MVQERCKGLVRSRQIQSPALPNLLSTITPSTIGGKAKFLYNEASLRGSLRPDVRPVTLEEFLAELSPQPVDVFADGACSGNPGPGGWGVVWIQEDRRATKNGGEKATTNNRMELMAAIESLEALPTTVPVRMTTDSQYVKNGIEQWIRNWRQKGWLTTDRKPVKNQDLWKRLDALCEEHSVTWAWVKGHSGHTENERADALARQAIARVMMGFAG